MDLLRSSILGREFVNHRKKTAANERVRFSTQVRKQGVGNIPIVVDSVDPQLSKALSDNFTGRRFIIHMDHSVEYLLDDIKLFLFQNKRLSTERLDSLVLGLEDGTFPEKTSDLGSLYKNYRNDNDKILYMLLSKEKSMMAYILSILKYLKDNFMNVMEKFTKA
jgi:hypothetical protein